MNSLSWDLIRDFLVVARKGSLSQASKKLGVSQPTLSRNIQALEAKTKLNLFRRSTQGLVLTDAGGSLMDVAERMAKTACMFERQVTGLSAELKGDVRIAANEVVAHYLLPPVITAFRQEHQKINIDIVVSNATTSLSKREADIALRMYRPTQPDLVARRLPDMPLALYATNDYINRQGMPKDIASLDEHDIIGFDEVSCSICEVRALGKTFTRNQFSVRTDNLLTQISLGRMGAGILCTHRNIARHMPELIPILEELELPPVECWLVCHADTQYNSCIRILLDFIAEWFQGNPYQHLEQKYAC